MSWSQLRFTACSPDPSVDLEFQRTCPWFRSHQSHLCSRPSQPVPASSPVPPPSLLVSWREPSQRADTYHLSGFPPRSFPGHLLQAHLPGRLPLSSGHQSTRLPEQSLQNAHPITRCHCLLSSPVKISAFGRSLSLFPHTLPSSHPRKDPAQMPSSPSTIPVPPKHRESVFVLSQGSLSRMQVHGSDPDLCMVVRTVPQDILEILDETDVSIGIT